MRIVSLLFLLALAVAPAVHGQTLDHPWFFTADPYVQTVDTCRMAPQELYFLETGDDFYQPAAVYEVLVAQNFLHPIRLTPWNVYMYPQGADLAVWVCGAHSGKYVYDCLAVSDNGWNQYNLVQVPAKVGVYYVIVTQGINSFSSLCGKYVLNAAN